MKRVCVTFLFLLLGVLCSASAKPLKLKIIRGATYEGSIREVKDKTVIMLTTGGQAYQIPMQSLDANGKRSVNEWIRKRGGNTSYTSWIGTTSKHFSKSWPRNVNGPSSIGLKKRYDLNTKGIFVYETNHFRFFLNTEVDIRVVQRFSVLFETTHKFVTSLPINAAANYMENDAKFKIFLFGDLGSYYRSGGMRGAAGVYIPKHDAILIPLHSLGVTWNGKQWKYKPKKNNKVLVHEIAHQLTNGVDFAAWYIEGSAEYIAATRYTDGAYHGIFHMGDHRKCVFDYATKSAGMDVGDGRGLGDTIQMPSLQRFMTLPYGVFSGRDGNKNYGVAMLLTDFFYHKEGRGDGAAIKKYIKAKQTGVSERKAHQLLLGRKNYKQLEKEFQSHCAKQGVKIVFPTSR